MYKVTSDPSIKIINSGTPGPTLLVLGGIHGNEHCGINLVQSILCGAYQPAFSTGTLIVALGNLDAIKANKRSIHCNLNRSFTESNTCECTECARTVPLKQLMQRADVLLDIHASFTPNSEPFIICEKNALYYASQLPVRTVCLGFTKLQPGGTDDYMYKLGKPGLCLECGYLGDDSSQKIAKKCFQTMVDTLLNTVSIQSTNSQVIYKDVLQYKTGQNFSLAKEYKDFEPVTKGQLIGLDGDREVRATQTGVVVFARNQTRSGQEAFVLLESN